MWWLIFCQLDWATGSPDIWFNIILGCSVRVFLENISIWLCRLSKDPPSPTWVVTCSPLRAWIKHSVGRRLNSLSVWLLERRLVLPRPRVRSYSIGAPGSAAREQPIVRLLGFRLVSQFLTVNLLSRYTGHTEAHSSGSVSLENPDECPTWHGQGDTGRAAAWHRPGTRGAGDARCDRSQPDSRLHPDS